MAEKAQAARQAAPRALGMETVGQEPGEQAGTAWEKGSGSPGLTG